MVEAREAEAAKSQDADEDKHKLVEYRLYDLSYVRYMLDNRHGPYFIGVFIRAVDDYDYEAHGRGLRLLPSKTATEEPSSTQKEIVGVA